MGKMSAYSRILCLTSGGAPVYGGACLIVVAPVGLVLAGDSSEILVVLVAFLH